MHWLIEEIKIHREDDDPEDEQWYPDLGLEEPGDKGGEVHRSNPRIHSRSGLGKSVSVSMLTIAPTSGDR